MAAIKATNSTATNKLTTLKAQQITPSATER